MQIFLSMKTEFSLTASYPSKYFAAKEGTRRDISHFSHALRYWLICNCFLCNVAPIKKSIAIKIRLTRNFSYIVNVFKLFKA